MTYLYKPTHVNYLVDFNTTSETTLINTRNEDINDNSTVDQYNINENYNSTGSIMSDSWLLVYLAVMFVSFFAIISLINYLTERSKKKIIRWLKPCETLLDC